jgi:hypothetical protein
LVTESQRFLEIDKLRVAKLEKLRSVESDLVVQRAERDMAMETLVKERELNAALVDQNRALMSRLESSAASFEAERAALQASAEASTRTESGRISELEEELARSANIIESLRAELQNTNESTSILQIENKSLKALVSTKQADFNLQMDKMKRELSELGASKDKIISEQRALIDQLSNSMSEAATQLMESQNVSKFHQSDLDNRDKKIRALDEKVEWLEENVRDRTDRLITEENAGKELKKQIDQFLREKEIILAQLEATQDELKLKIQTLQSMEDMKRKTDLLQSNLVSELQSLPIINKRLESDCSFLRDDLKSVSEKLRSALIENQSLADRLKAVDSVLSPEQRLKVNHKATGVAPAGGADLKKLQIETMELRMRLVDSQAARDKAQAHLIEQSQLIAKLQRELRTPDQLIGN